MAETPVDARSETSENKHTAAGGAKEPATVALQGAAMEGRPAVVELAGWHAYAFCSYFVHTVLIPVLFPLIITQATAPSPSSSPGGSLTNNPRGIPCLRKEMLLYQSLVNHSISASGSEFSPLRWTAVSWAAGTALAAPVLVPAAWHLDHIQFPPLVLVGATVVGAIFCLLTGFFSKRWIFPVYIAAVAAADTVGAAAHTRNLGVFVGGVTARFTGRRHFPRRRAVTGLLSLGAAAAGCLGAAIIAAFTYHMLRRSDKHTSLWVVSIFSGLLWVVGIAHAFTVSLPDTATTRSRSNPGKISHVLAIFKYPHAAGSLVGIFLSSFSSMCIFTGGVLNVFGQLCIKPITMLCIWMIYFISPVVSLPALHPLQQLLQADAVRMQLLGFLMSSVTAGAGFFYRDGDWRRTHVLLAALLQGTAAGTLHAFGRALVSDCSPAGREGAFSAWASWVRTAGTCAGFAVASVYPGNVGRTFGISFCAAAGGICVLLFGNISHLAGVEAAGHVGKGAEECCLQGHEVDEVGETERPVCAPSHLADHEVEGKSGGIQQA